jgi:hypothetical protein
MFEIENIFISKLSQDRLKIVSEFEINNQNCKIYFFFFLFFLFLLTTRFEPMHL